MLPSVVDEKLVRWFHYWNGDLCYGMFNGKELFALSQAYSPSNRLAAYEAAYALAEKGAVICITASQTGYTVWVSLRSLPLLVKEAIASPIAAVAVVG